MMTVNQSECLLVTVFNAEALRNWRLKRRNPKITFVLGDSATASLKHGPWGSGRRSLKGFKEAGRWRWSECPEGPTQTCFQSMKWKGEIADSQGIRNFAEIFWWKLCAVLLCLQWRMLKTRSSHEIQALLELIGISMLSRRETYYPGEVGYGDMQNE